jgi:hypothetical protein
VSRLLVGKSSVPQSTARRDSYHNAFEEVSDNVLEPDIHESEKRFFRLT